MVLGWAGVGETEDGGCSQWQRCSSLILAISLASHKLNSACYSLIQHFDSARIPARLRLACCANGTVRHGWTPSQETGS